SKTLEHRDGATMTEASMQIARSLDRGPYYAYLLRNWARHWISNEAIPYFRQGQHVKVRTLLEDEDIDLAVRSYLCEHKFEVTPALPKYLETEIFPRKCLATIKISEETVRKWMIKVSISLLVQSCYIDILRRLLS